MASSREYADYIMEQLSELSGVDCRAMMGEYVLRYRGKTVGGIYDNRLLVKPVRAAVGLMPDTEYELPYPGAKEMLLVDRVEDRTFLAALLNAIYDELPPPKGKSGKIL